MAKSKKRFKIIDKGNHVIKKDLLDQIFNLAGFPVETMTYKTNNLSISYPRYKEDSNGKK